MTIQAAVSEKAYAGDGITVVFPIPFPFDTAADLKLTSTDASGNILTLSTGFTISGGAGSTGNATFSVAPIPGVTITICDNPALTQPTDYVSLDAFPAESHERALDRVTRIAKRLYQLIQRSVRFPDGDVSTDGVLGSVANRKGKYLFFNAVTGAIEYAANIVTTTLSQSVIGQLLFPQTPAEIAASAAPTNYAYAPWRGEDVRRFGAVGNGVADDRGALNVANSIGASLYLPAGTYLINSNITFTVPLILDYGAKLKPANGVTITLNKDVQAGLWQVFDYSASGLVAGLKRSHVAWFGALGDGSTDDVLAINRALTATTGGVTYMGGQGTYKITAAGIMIPDDTRLLGDNKRACKILVGANVDGITLGDGSQFEYIYLEGNATTGKGIVFPSGKGNQTLRSFRAINFDVGTGGGVLHFADNTAGSRCVVEDWEASQTNGVSGSDKYAVYMPDVFNNSAVPRKFSHGETGGKCAFFFGGCNDVFIGLSFLADCKFSTNSRAVHMLGNRIANQVALAIDGANHSIVGVDTNPQIILNVGLTNSKIDPGSIDKGLNAFHLITGITQAASAVVTVSTVSGTNPFLVGQYVTFDNVLGMTQINGLNGPVTAIGGASGAWTVTVSINSSGFGAYTAGGNLCAPGIVDNTGGNNSVQVFQQRQIYNPQVTAAGGGFVMGNGTALGYYARTGSTTEGVINFTVGTTTVLGTGALQFTLPMAKQDGEVIAGSGSAIINHAGTLYTAVVQIAGNVGVLTLIRDTSGSVTFNSPAALASPDTIRIAFWTEP